MPDKAWQLETKVTWAFVSYQLTPCWTDSTRSRLDQDCYPTVLGQSTILSVSLRTDESEIRREKFSRHFKTKQNKTSPVLEKQLAISASRVCLVKGLSVCLLHVCSSFPALVNTFLQLWILSAAADWSVGDFSVATCCAQDQSSPLIL